MPDLFVVGQSRNEPQGARMLSGAVAQLVAHLHGMEGVRGSSPLSSTFSEGGVLSGAGSAGGRGCPISNEAVDSHLDRAAHLFGIVACAQRWQLPDPLFGWSAQPV